MELSLSLAEISIHKKNTKFCNKSQWRGLAFRFVLIFSQANQRTQNVSEAVQKAHFIFTCFWLQVKGHVQWSGGILLSQQTYLTKI